MAGSIRRRPDRGPDALELRISIGRDRAGRGRHMSTLFRGAKRAAERELARLVAKQTTTPAVVPSPDALAWGSTTTINDAIADWQRNGWDDLSPSTTRRYRSMIANQIEQSIGRRVGVGVPKSSVHHPAASPAGSAASPPPAPVRWPVGSPEQK